MDAITIIFSVIILIASVILHELGHGYAAEYLGDPTPRIQGRLTLNPLKHLDPFGSVIFPALMAISGTGMIFGWAKPVEFNMYNLRNKKWGPVVVAMAGPAVNIVLAIIFSLVIHFIPMMPAFAGFGAIASLIVYTNILLAIFNLVPVPPLDGHYVLFALLPSSWNRFKMLLTRYSFVLLIFFVFFLWKYLQPLVEFVYTIFVGIHL